MGYLLKEVLKAICGVNQWSYAVFWKIGCQNPKLLIWEECYYGSSPSAPHDSNLQKQDGYNNGGQVGDKVHLLMDRMMMSNHVNVVGEGLVGRAAFTGNHQWIVSGIYNEIAHPAEVLNEIRHQFSAGMQTIAVIPVIPHGVLQLGSPLTMMENVGFVHDVRSFILQVGCIPNAFLSDNYYAKDTTSMTGFPVADVTANPLNLHGNPTTMNFSGGAVGNFNLQRNTSEIHGLPSQSSNCLLTQFQDNLQVSGSTFMNYDAARTSPFVNSDGHPNGQVENKITRGLVMPLKPDTSISQPTSNCPGSGSSYHQSSASRWHPTKVKQLTVSHEGSVAGNYSTLTSVFNPSEGHHAASKENINLLSGKNGLDVGINGERVHSFQTSASSNLVVHELTSSSMLTGALSHGIYTKDGTLNATYISKLQDNDNGEVLETPAKKSEHMQSGGVIHDEFNIGSHVTPLKCSVPENIFVQSSAGDDLFDVLGVDLKNRLLSGNNSYFPNNFSANSKNQMQNSGSEFYSKNEEISESGVFSSPDSDHLLDAVICGVGSATRQISDDNASCKTTVSKISSSSVPSTPHSNPPLSGLFNMSDRMQSQLFGLSKPLVRLVEPIGSSVRSACGKNDDISCTYGSQISSWIEQGPTTSVSTANSKKSDGGKSNRKRLKPGENPRPRPKDRQMIQDRVKELRDIVPNGAKCSIDALLERTIKHMLFLQSVTKHADKLKQTVESKIANKEGGMFLKDEFQGSATWAFELGSQSLVCPIVVEDLNPPRQLLIEMQCEERGFFLEIADIVRGLGLTILKGVMEARDDKIWARFAVEANRDVTRMEVFISLVHLLEQTLKNSTTSLNATNDENTGVLPTSMPGNHQLIAPIVCGEPSMI